MIERKITYNCDGGVDDYSFRHSNSRKRILNTDVYLLDTAYDKDIFNYKEENYDVHVYIDEVVYTDIDTYMISLNIVKDKRTNKEFLQISIDDGIYLNLDERWSERILNTSKDMLYLYAIHVERESKEILKCLTESKSKNISLMFKMYTVTHDTTFTRLIKSGIFSVFCDD